MTEPMKPIVFYSFPLSGHAHRVELLLRGLHIDDGRRREREKVPRRVDLAIAALHQKHFVDDRRALQQHHHKEAILENAVFPD